MGVCTNRFGDGIGEAWVDEEVLAEPVDGLEAVPGQQLFEPAAVGRIERPAQAVST